MATRVTWSLVALILAVCGCFTGVMSVTQSELHQMERQIAARRKHPARASGSGGSVPSGFQVLWNSPFAGCQSCSDPGARLSESAVRRFGITANTELAFNGERIAMLYGPGRWPTLAGHYTGRVPCWADSAVVGNCTWTPFENITATNGGVPQRADLQRHVAAVASSVSASIPDKDFSGLLILDFEGWRPVAADNDADYVDYNVPPGAGYTLSLYTQYSRALVQLQNPTWSSHEVTSAATAQFEAAAQAFFSATIEACKLTRPRARVGFYGYPGMLSAADLDPHSYSTPQLLWLWQQLDVLTPSNYLWTEFDGRSVERAMLNVNMSMQLAKMVGGKTGRRPGVWPYLWIWPSPSNETSWSGNRPARGRDLSASVAVPAAMGTDGAVLWGSSDDVGDEQIGSHCTLWPLIEQCIHTASACRQAACSGHGNCASMLDSAGAMECQKFTWTSCVCDSGWGGLDCNVAKPR